MKGPRGSSCVAGTRDELAGCVRVCCLDRLYHIKVLHSLNPHIHLLTSFDRGYILELPVVQ